MSEYARAERQRVRRRNGQYDDSQPCEACGKPAGFDYWSVGSPAPEGLVLCNRKRCPAVKLAEQYGAESDAPIIAFIRSKKGS